MDGKGVGQADQEAGAASGVQGVQGEGSETSEEMQVPGDWWEEEQGCSAVLSWFLLVSMNNSLEGMVCLLVEFILCVIVALIDGVIALIDGGYLIINLMIVIISLTW